MWRVIGFLADNSDPEYVIWHLIAERADGRIQSVRVKIDRFSVADHIGPVEGPFSKWGSDGIRSKGKALVELNESETLPPSYVFGIGGFIAESD